MFRTASLLVSLLALVYGCGPSRPVTPDPDCASCADAGPIDSRAQVSIASLNVHLLFDPVCDSGRCGDGEWEALPTAEEFAARADTIAAAIRTLNTGIVLLQEVENQAALDAIASRLPELPYSVLGEIGGAATVDVAVVSAHPILEVRTHRENSIVTPSGSFTRFSREFLEVHLDVDGARVAVFAAHFRSKVNDDPDRRWAEANAARLIALQTAQQGTPALVVVGGDLNDVPGSPPLEILENGGELVRASSDLPLEAIGTYSYRGESQAIDHLLIVSGPSGDTVPKSFEVVRDSGARGFGGSDHGAIRARFYLGP